MHGGPKKTREMPCVQGHHARGQSWKSRAVTGQSRDSCGTVAGRFRLVLALGPQNGFIVATVVSHSGTHSRPMLGPILGPFRNQFWTNFGIRFGTHFGSISEAPWELA